VAEGTKSLVPADVDVAGLETGRFDEVIWRSASYIQPVYSHARTQDQACGWALVLYSSAKGLDC